MQVKMLKDHREFQINEIARVTDIRGQAMIDQDFAELHEGSAVARKKETATKADRREQRSKKERRKARR